MGWASREVSPKKAYLTRSVSGADLRRSGVTLIEVLMVVVLLAMAVAIILPQFTGRKHHGDLNTMREDLSRLVEAEQRYFASHGAYTTSFPREQFAPSPGVTITDWTTTPTGWSASASHAGPPSATPNSCHVTVDTSGHTGGYGTPICP